MPRPEPTRAHVDVVALQGIPEVTRGADLARLLVDAAEDLRDGDVLVVSSKVVSKAAGLTLPATQRQDAVERQSVRLVAQRRTARGLAQIVESLAGPVMAAAGVDASNVPSGEVLTLPGDPDAAARELRAGVRRWGAPRVAVVVSDTAGRAWRTGQTDFALGCAGLVVTDDLRGSSDASGTVLEVTERAIADEVAAAADLVKGKASGTPAACVRGLAAFVTDADGPGAASLLRDPSSDWFRMGHVEAVRAALGLPPGAVEAPSVTTEPLRRRAHRALDVALALGQTGPRDVVTGIDDADGSCRITVETGDEFTSGLIVGRLLAALWSEDLVGELQHDLTAHVSHVIVNTVVTDAH